MSTTAIKKLFEDSKRRKIILQKKTNKVIPEEQMIVINDQKLKDAIEIIKHWDGGHSELISFYNNLNDEEYHYAMANRDSFPYEIKAMLWPDEFNPPLGKNSTLKVRELTEEGYRRLLLDKMKKREKLIEERMSTMTFDPMPRSHLETALVGLKNILETKEKQLEEVKKSIDTGKYMTPSKRVSAVQNNPAVVSLSKAIQEIKNELEKTDQRLKVLRDEWERNERYRLRHKIEQELTMSGL